MLSFGFAAEGFAEQPIIKETHDNAVSNEGDSTDTNDNRSSSKTTKNNTIEPSESPKDITVNAKMTNGTGARTSLPVVNFGPLGDMKPENAPFSILSVPHDVIRNQQARNVNDLMQYLPSVQLEMRGDPGTSRPQSRGFESDVIANSRMDGFNIATTTPYAAEQFDNLQVLNGLSGAIYGPQNPAGTFEYTLKRPTTEMMEDFSVGIDSRGTVTEAADIGGSTGKDNWFGYRVNLVHGAGSNYVRTGHINRNLVSGSFDIHVDSKTVIELNASHYSYDQRGGAPGFSYSNNIQLPTAPDISTPYLGQSYAGYNAKTDTASGKIKHQFNENWSVVAGGLWQNAFRDVFSNANTLTDNYGDYKQTIASAATAYRFKIGSNLAYLNGRVHTGFVTHDLALGTNGYVMSNYNPTSSQTFTLGNSNLYNPTKFSSVRPHSSGSYRSAIARNQSLIVSDMITFNKHWSILGAFSWSWMTSSSWNKAGTRTAHNYTQGAFSPNTSLIYHPLEGHTAYFTWGRSLQQGVTAPAGSINQGQILNPYESEEYELGYKVKWEKLSLNVAGFRMTRPYAYMDSSTGVYGMYGTQRNWGFEFQMAGHIRHDLSILGGVTWLDAKVGSTGDATTSHKEIVGVPPVQSNILIDYTLPFSKESLANGLAINGSVHYTGTRAANNTNTTYAPQYVTANIGIRYPFKMANKPWVARFTVNNLMNEHYWASVYPSSINGAAGGTNSAYAGLPRTYQFTLECTL
ncbi:MAG: TonB-dependent receptor [Zymomonas mobilis subsp. pomaceae]